MVFKLVLSPKPDSEQESEEDSSSSLFKTLTDVPVVAKEILPKKRGRPRKEYVEPLERAKPIRPRPRPASHDDFVYHFDGTVEKADIKPNTSPGGDNSPIGEAEKFVAIKACHITKYNMTFTVIEGQEVSITPMPKNKSFVSIAWHTGIIVNNSVIEGCFKPRNKNEQD